MTYQELVKKVQTALVKADASGITEHIAVQVNVTGDAAGAFYIEVRDGVLYVEPYDYNDRDCLLTGDSKEILAIAQGKNNLQEAIMEAHVYCDGNYDKISLLSDIIPKKVKKPRTPKTETVKTTEKAKASEKSEKTPAKKTRKAKAEKPAEVETLPEVTEAVEVNEEKTAAPKRSRKSKTDKTEKTTEEIAETATGSVTVNETSADIVDSNQIPLEVTEAPEKKLTEKTTEEPEAELTDAPETAPDVIVPEVKEPKKNTASKTKRPASSSKKTTPADSPISKNTGKPGTRKGKKSKKK
ncbi:MAG: SCP2 sterol-binding domain-containing protein [Oscillospiraceae bacterium]|nr:SCP2 sterol-binding domain-containing protein [Oscillospiraceae bacterium]